MIKKKDWTDKIVNGTLRLFHFTFISINPLVKYTKGLQKNYTCKQKYKMSSENIGEGYAFKEYFDKTENTKGKEGETKDNVNVNKIEESGWFTVVQPNKRKFSPNSIKTVGNWPKKCYRSKLKNEKKKMLLVELMKEEEVIWNKQHASHYNTNAVNDAWERISDNISGTTVKQCRTMWRSLKDALRYREKVAVKNKSNNICDQEPDDADDEENEIINVLSFLKQNVTASSMKSSSMDVGENESLSDSQSEYSYDFKGFLNVMIDKDENDASEYEIESQEEERSITKTQTLITENPSKLVKDPRCRMKNIEEKKFLAQLVKKEQLIWDKRHESHCNPNALNAAWKRIAAQIPPATVGECKVMWKSLRDALRYQMMKDVAADKYDSNENVNYDENVEENELKKILAFLIPNITATAGKSSSLYVGDSESLKSLNGSQSDSYQDFKDFFTVIKTEVDDGEYEEPYKKENNVIRNKRGNAESPIGIEYSKRQCKISNVEQKKLLIQFIKSEKIIWDKQHELHSNSNALNAAWKRIADKMPLTTAVSECKNMWKNLLKSIKDPLRYHTMKDGVNEKYVSHEDENLYSDQEENELKNMLGFLNESPRKHGTIYIASSESLNNELKDNKIASSSDNEKKSGNCNENNKISKSLGDISNNINKLVNLVTSQTQIIKSSVTPHTFKYDYIWKLLESLYLQMDESIINKVNHEIINLVYEHCNKANLG